MLERQKCHGMVLCQGNNKLEPTFFQTKTIPPKKMKESPYQESPYLGFAFRTENKNLHETKTKNENSERKRKAGFLMPLIQ